jgi:hypothetical protein
MDRWVGKKEVVASWSDCYCYVQRSHVGGCELVVVVGVYDEEVRLAGTRHMRLLMMFGATMDGR